MRKVLIVDDAADTVDLLTYVLKDQGYDVCAAHNGRQALEVASAQRPDVILLDVMMPEMNGIEACRRLKADPELRMIPVLMVTAKELDEDIVAGLDAGAEDYVTKPFNHLVLAARLRAALRVKEFRDELAHINEQLRVETENLEKKEAQLREAQKLEAVGQLAGGIAHEFNNLLQVIGGYANCAKEGLSPQEERYLDLQQVLKAADRAGTLTRQLLRFSRRRVIQPTSVDPNQVVANLAEMLRPLIGEHIALEMILGNGVGAVQVDADEFQQALLNLCLNARDAMPSGGALTLKTGSVMLRNPLWDSRFQITPGRHAVLSVSDTGCGMSAEVQRRIFEPFFTTKEVGKGTGLGLAMVYGVVQQHQGAIHVYSEPGKGTTFKIYLPMAGTPAGDEHAAESEPAPGGSETILVAEDDPFVRDLAVRILEKNGYTVRVASNGEEALRIFEQDPAAISLMLLDAIMPKLSGHEVYRRVAAEHPQAKVIFASGYDPEAAGCRFLMEEHWRLIEKPFDAATLLRAVREVLDGEAGDRDLATTGGAVTH
jgi:DNA-binding response OmpR family regulator